jgi:hypothetical protein
MHYETFPDHKVGDWKASSQIYSQCKNYAKAANVVIDSMGEGWHEVLKEIIDATPKYCTTAPFRILTNLS